MFKTENPLLVNCKELNKTFQKALFYSLVQKILIYNH